MPHRSYYFHGQLPLIPIGIVTCTPRLSYGLALAEKVEAEVISIDDNRRGPEWNHCQVLEWMRDSDHEWSVILEDDVEVVEGFRSQLEDALRWAPTPFVGLYVGRGRPPHWQNSISAIIARDVCWLKCDTMMNAVGYAIKTKLVPSVLHSLQKTWRRTPRLPIDEALTAWGHSYRIPFCYTRPSLVNHLDITPVAKHSYGIPTEKRVAWLFGKRENWDGSTAFLEHIASW